ncbi:hypothetical protein OHB56_39305 [Streptomyces sp. NBC_01635]|uniref:hypothetical protein n=1 Tax=Streptomyces sp. NBC_01635 TaxID=2975904 RepID=UPI00386D4743|nr:hypothetical protein OHB56_39305 [Streptomyces sp. NBC_01635]
MHDVRTHHRRAWREFLAGRAGGVTAVGFLHLDAVLGRRLLRTRVLGGVVNEYRYAAGPATTTFRAPQVAGACPWRRSRIAGRTGCANARTACGSVNSVSTRRSPEAIDVRASSRVDGVK